MVQLNAISLVGLLQRLRHLNAADQTVKIQVRLIRQLSYPIRLNLDGLATQGTFCGYRPLHFILPFFKIAQKINFGQCFRLWFWTKDICPPITNVQKLQNSLEIADFQNNFHYFQILQFFCHVKKTRQNLLLPC